MTSISALRPFNDVRVLLEEEALVEIEKEGKRLAELRRLEQEKLKKESKNLKPKIITSVSDNDFYKFSMEEVREKLSKDYLKFLKKSGYAPELDSASGLMIAKRILKADDEVRKLISENNIEAKIEDNTNYVVNINHANSKRLVNLLGYQLPTTGIMYRLFIPSLKDLAESGNEEAKANLNEMNTKAEWLEDLVLDKLRLKIGNAERRIILPDKDGRFDRADISEYGYPTLVRDHGEFYHWHVSGDERAAIRSRDSEFYLSLVRGPSVESDGLGVRRAKIF